MPLAFSGPVIPKTEEGLFQYVADDEKKSSKNLDVVQTILNLEKYANESGYTHKQIKDFLGSHCQKKIGPKSFEHFEVEEDPNVIANTLMEIYFEAAPINRFSEVLEFVRPPDEAITSTVV